MAIKFILFWMLVLMGVTCIDGDIIYRNESAQLSTIPSDIPYNAVKVFLKHNSITAVPEAALANLMLLTNLSLERNLNFPTFPIIFMIVYYGST